MQKILGNIINLIQYYLTARSQINRKGVILGFAFALSTVIVLLTPSLSNAFIVNRTSNPLNEVRIVPTTVIGQPDFFHAGKSTKDRWWLIDPDRKPFLYKGVTSVNFSYPDAYIPAVLDKYGEDPSTFRKSAFERLRSWNFNALGAWTPPELWDRGMPYIYRYFRFFQNSLDRKTAYRRFKYKTTRRFRSKMD